MLTTHIVSTLFFFWQKEGKQMVKRVIKLDDENMIIRRYCIRPTGKNAATIETSIPKEALEREARRRGLTVQQAINELVAVWRFNSFHGLFLSFEPKERTPKKPVAIGLKAELESVGKETQHL
jgi:hypothetical protein